MSDNAQPRAVLGLKVGEHCCRAVGTTVVDDDYFAVSYFRQHVKSVVNQRRYRWSVIVCRKEHTDAVCTRIF